MPCARPSGLITLFLACGGARRRTEEREAQRRPCFAPRPADRERPRVPIESVADLLSLLEEGAADALMMQPSLSRARTLAHIVVTGARVLEVSDFAARIEVLEAQHSKVKLCR